MHFGPLVAAEMVDQLMQVVGEGVLRVGALMQLEQDVADGAAGPRAIARQGELEIVLPFDLVAHMVFIPRVGGIREREHFAGVSEGKPGEVIVEIGVAGIAAVLVPEATAAGTGRRVPGGVGLSVRAQHGVRVVLGLGTAVVGAWCPGAHGAARRRAGRIQESIALGAGGSGGEREGEDREAGERGEAHAAR